MIIWALRFSSGGHSRPALRFLTGVYNGTPDLFLARFNGEPDLVLLNNGHGTFRLTDDRLGHTASGEPVLTGDRRLKRPHFGVEIGPTW